MLIELPSLAILASIQDSETEMYIHPNGHQLFVAVPPDDRIIMFVVEEDLNKLTDDQVNLVLQREFLLHKIASDPH